MGCLQDKAIIGRGMRSRGGRVEVQLACRILNTMTRLGVDDLAFSSCPGDVCRHEAA